MLSDARPAPRQFALLGALVWLLAWVIPASAQQVGGVRGRVLDPEFNAALPNATVVLEGAGVSVQTGPDGTFTFGDVPPGNYEISIQREGYNRARASNIIVNAGRFTETSVEMTGQVVELEDFVVTAEDLVGTQEFQLDIQQSLTSFANVLGGDFISRIGASDVGKALSKVAGINIIGDRYVVVRGLADRYNAVLLNSAGVPSSDPDRRAPNIDLFPGSIVQSLQTSKTFTPDLPGEATGGSINIITKSVPDKNFTKAKVGAGYDTLATGNSKFLTYAGGGTGFLGSLEQRRLPDFIRGAPLPRQLGPAPGIREDQIFRDKVNDALPRTMGTSQAPPGPDFTFESTIGRKGEYLGKPAGLLFALDYRKQYRFDPDGLEARYLFGPDGNPVIVQRRAQVQRGTDNVRGSLLAVAGVQPQPGDEIKLTVFANLSAQDRASLRQGPKDLPPGPNPPPSDVDYYRESLVYTERRLQVLQLTGRHHWDGPDGSEQDVFKWFGTYNRSSQYEPDQRFIEGEINKLTGAYRIAGGGQTPPARRFYRELFDERWNFGGDYERLLFEEGEKQTKLKLGGGFDVSTRDYRADNFAYISGANSPEVPNPNKPLPFPDATLGDVWNYGNPPNASIDPTRFEQGHYLFRSSTAETYDAFLSIPAGFAMFDSDIAKDLNVTFGLRWEQSNYDIEATDILEVAKEDVNLAVQLLPPEARTPENVQDLANPNTERAQNNPVIEAARFVRLNETHVLPSFTARWKMTETMKLRGAFSRTIARPSFKELAPVAFRDAESGDDFVGNSTLQISNIDNYDARWEWYPRSGGQVGVSLFSKFIEDPIELQNIGLKQFINSKDAVIYGAELDFSSDLALIHESLRPFTIGGNYAYLRSQATRDTTSVFGTTRRLQGQPDYIFNFNLTFDDPEWGLSAGVLLNVTGVYLDAVGNNNVPDIFVDPLTTLNAFVSYRLGKAGKLTLRANNLTTPTQKRTYANGDRSLYDQQNSSTQYSFTYEIEL